MLGRENPLSLPTLAGTSRRDPCEPACVAHAGALPTRAQRKLNTRSARDCPLMPSFSTVGSPVARDGAMGRSCSRLAAAAARVRRCHPNALHAGQRATVRTVFGGRLDRDIRGRDRRRAAGGRAEGDLILARGLGPRLAATGVAQGMSGSPVYVDGKLIGALSSGWAFAREPIFGVTPIGEMLSVLDEPENSAGDATPGPVGVDPVSGARARYASLSWGDDDSLVIPPPGAQRSVARLAAAAAGGERRESGRHGQHPRDVRARRLRGRCPVGRERTPARVPERRRLRAPTPSSPAALWRWMCCAET